MSPLSQTSTILNLNQGTNPLNRFIQRFTAATKLLLPDALIFRNHNLSVLESFASVIPEVINLPRHLLKNVSPIFSPELPTHKAFFSKQTNRFDVEGYVQALEQYKIDLHSFFEKVRSGQYTRGLLVKSHRFPLVLFNTQLPAKNGPLVQLAA